MGSSREYSARYYREWRETMIRAGKWFPHSVDGGPVQQHLWALRRAGWRYAAIAEAAGVSLSTVNKLVYCRQDRPTVSGRSATALLAVTGSPPDGRARVDDDLRVQTQARALAALGYTTAWVAARAGVSVRTAQEWRIRPQSRVTRDVAARVDALMAEVGDTPGPSKQAATKARKQGYLPPIYYDDDWHLIEEPHRGVGRPPAVVAEDVEWLRSWGLTDAAIAVRLGVDEKSIERADQRSAKTGEADDDSATSAA